MYLYLPGRNSVRVESMECCLILHDLTISHDKEMNVSFKSSLNLAKLSCANLIAFKQRFNLSLIYCNTSHALCPFVQNKGSG